VLLDPRARGPRVAASVVEEHAVGLGVAIARQPAVGHVTQRRRLRGFPRGGIRGTDEPRQPGGAGPTTPPLVEQVLLIAKRQQRHHPTGRSRRGVARFANRLNIAREAPLKPFVSQRRLGESLEVEFAPGPPRRLTLAQEIGNEKQQDPGENERQDKHLDQRETVAASRGHAIRR
jgi:hypothetical protein